MDDVYSFRSKVASHLKKSGFWPNSIISAIQEASASSNLCSDLGLDSCDRENLVLEIEEMSGKRVRVKNLANAEFKELIPS